MTIEINSVSIKNGIIRIEATDCSEENLQRIERYRDDGFEKKLTFVFDTKNNKKAFGYFNKWIHDQKATKGCGTYGEALKAIYGTVTSISGKYLELA